MANNVVFPIRILNEKLKSWGLPKPASDGAAAVDLMACIDDSVTLQPGQRFLFPTGLAIHLKDRTLAALILSRSGIGAKRGLTVAQGVGLIDSDYTGELMVMILNTSQQSQTIEPGERIAQLLITSIVRPTFEVVEELDYTHRGSRGFGSTGPGIQSK